MAVFNEDMRVKIPATIQLLRMCRWKYWQEVLKMVRTGEFDALGHIDFPKRYYGEIYYEEAVINEIFRNLLDKDLVIEMNTSSVRKGHVQTMPVEPFTVMEN